MANLATRTLPILAALGLAACEAGSLPCDGPSDCSGNACCLDQYISGPGGTHVYCTSTPDACPPKQTAEVATTRICRVDADCSAGGITTNEGKCCPSAVMNHSVGTCHGSCLPR